MSERRVQNMMSFTTTKRFRRDYDRLFERKPEAANLMLLLAEKADKSGNILLLMPPGAELAKLMAVRFDDPRAYALPGGPKQ